VVKKDLEIDLVMALVARAVQPFPPAAMFQLFDEGHTSLFEQLVACIISIRTLDEVTVPTARKLLGLAPTPAGMVRLSPQEIDQQIHDSSFHERKAWQIHRIAQQVLDEHGGELPCDREVLMAFSGVGVKCANLALGVACGEPQGISVDVHVHRVTNRWGYVAAGSPERTTVLLEAKLPRRFWLEINRLLVPFGKHICTGRLPRCSTCPVLEMCRQVGVDKHR